MDLLFRDPNLTFAAFGTVEDVAETIGQYIHAFCAHTFRAHYTIKNDTVVWEISDLDRYPLGEITLLLVGEGQFRVQPTLNNLDPTVNRYRHEWHELIKHVHRAADGLSLKVMQEGSRKLSKETTLRALNLLIQARAAEAQAQDDAFQRAISRRMPISGPQQRVVTVSSPVAKMIRHEGEPIETVSATETPKTVPPSTTRQNTKKRHKSSNAETFLKIQTLAQYRKHILEEGKRLPSKTQACKDIKPKIYPETVRARAPKLWASWDVPTYIWEDEDYVEDHDY
jgi:hypothetical protein